MTDASRTILARRLVVLTATAGFFLAASSFAQTSPAPATPAAPATQAAPAGPAGAPPAGHGMRHGHRGERGAQHFKHMDSDGDGVISRAEFDAAGQKMNEQRTKFFEMADANKDGKLSREEMQAFRQSHRRGPPGGQAQPGQPGGVAPK
jgi:EF-hand domain pair